MPKTTSAAKGATCRMRLTPAEARLIKARRGAEPSELPQVISGYRRPGTARDLIEIFRTICEANWSCVVGCSLDSADFDVDTVQDGYVTVRAASALDGFIDRLDADEREALKRYRATKAAGDAPDSEFRSVLPMEVQDEEGKAKPQDVEVRIMSRATWDRLDADRRENRDHGEGRQWAGVAIEDGRILALRLAPEPGRPWTPWGGNYVATPEVRADLLGLRRAVWALLEDRADVDCLSLEAGRNGESRFEFAMDAASVWIDIRDRAMD